jgi:hypothetical protein
LKRAEKANELRQSAVAKGSSKPGLKPVRPSDLSHITRSSILIDFFKLPLRKYRFRGWVPERNADRMDAEIREQLRQDSARTSLYRAIKRLEAYGLIRRMPEHGGLQLTELGITVAKLYESPSAISSSRYGASTARQKTIDLEGRIVKDGVRKAIQDRQIALADLVHAVQEYRKVAESTPLTLQGSDYAHAVHELNKVIDRADALLP